MGANVVSVPNNGGIVMVNGATGLTTVPSTAAHGYLYEAKGFKQYTIQVKGITSAVVTVYATLDKVAHAWFNSNPHASPAPATIWSPLDQFTSDGFYVVTGPFIAIGAAVTTYASGTIYVLGIAVP